MNDSNAQTPPLEIGFALRRLILSRASAINGKLLERLATVSDDLDGGHYLAVLGALDGLERQIETMRSFLLLLR